MMRTMKDMRSMAAMEAMVWWEMHNYSPHVYALCMHKFISLDRDAHAVSFSALKQ